MTGGGSHAEIRVGEGGESAVLPDLRDVEAGAEILVTRRGQPVARIVPAQPSRERQLTPEQEAAHARSMAAPAKGWDLGGGKFNRDELYDD